MPLIYETNTALSGIELVTEVPKSNVEFYKRCAAYASFLLPLKVPSHDERHMDDGKHFTKSNMHPDSIANVYSNFSKFKISMGN